MKIFEWDKRLEKKMEDLETSLDETRQLTSQIKEDTEKIIIDVEWVRILIERQMLRIKHVEKYMKKNLGSDWSQLKNKWSEYKQGDITRGDFIKVALQKLGKPNMLEGSGQLNLGPEKEGSYLQKKAPVLKGTFQIGEDPSKGKYLQIDYEIAKGSYKKTLSKSYWVGLSKGLESVLKQPFSNFEK